MDRRIDQTSDNRRNSTERPVPSSLLWRLHRALGPIAGGLVLDFVDLTTFGPLGAIGLFIGVGVGWWISSIYNFSPRVRVILALLAGTYCLLPMTELLPVATIISGVARFGEEPRVGSKGSKTRIGEQGLDDKERVAPEHVARVKQH